MKMKPRRALLRWLAALFLAVVTATSGMAQLKLPWELEKKDPAKDKGKVAPATPTVPTAPTLPVTPAIPAAPTEAVTPKGEPMKEPGQQKPETPVAPAATALETAHRVVLEALAARANGRLVIGATRRSAEKIETDLSTATGERATLVWVEKENDGAKALVVWGPPESEGDLCRLEKTPQGWSVVTTSEPQPGEPPQADATREGVVARFFGAVTRDEVDAAYRCMSQDYRNDVSAAAFGAFVRFWAILGKHSKREVREVFHRKDVATLRAKLTTSGTDGLTIEFQLVKDQDRWDIDSIAILADEEGAHYQQGRTPAIAEVSSGFGKASGRDEGVRTTTPTWQDVVSREIAMEELQSLSADGLKRLRNETFARHGYQFKQRDLAAYFRKQPWYFATTDDQGSITAELSVLEKQNVDRIVAEEERRR